jgi:site-specific DNA recombinase
MPKAAIYCRAACADERALEAQRLSVHCFAKTLGYMDRAEYLDNGVSGLSLDRPAFSQMTADIRTGLISAVLVKNVARIGRNMIDFYAWMGEMGVHRHIHE